MSTSSKEAAGMAFSFNPCSSCSMLKISLNGVTCKRLGFDPHYLIASGPMRDCTVAAWLRHQIASFAVHLGFARQTTGYRCSEAPCCTVLRYALLPSTTATDLHPLGFVGSLSNIWTKMPPCPRPNLTCLREHSCRHLSLKLILRQQRLHSSG